MSQARFITRRTVAPRAAGARATSPRLGLALVVIATAQLMVVLDATIVDVALPRGSAVACGTFAPGPSAQDSTCSRTPAAQVTGLFTR